LLVYALRDRLRTRDYMDSIGNNFTDVPTFIFFWIIDADQIFTLPFFYKE